uniref:Uncharacterized protein n=1 Tax=Cannabis sativa TaxID=3483 RepID=A0A803QRV3_CANSA
MLDLDHSLRSDRRRTWTLSRDPNLDPGPEPRAEMGSRLRAELPEPGSRAELEPTLECPGPRDWDPEYGPQAWTKPIVGIWVWDQATDGNPPHEIEPQIELRPSPIPKSGPKAGTCDPKVEPKARKLARDKNYDLTWNHAKWTRSRQCLGQGPRTLSENLDPQLGGWDWDPTQTLTRDEAEHEIRPKHGTGLET